uniref:DUF4283 domain-containing protein n=1 Tax=Salix viminalis TaxID=40686 RepID=A0A6N2MWU5_SALVM
MNSIANRIWKRFGLEDVTSLANGFTMFHFKTGNELQKVLENGPWMFGGGGKPLFFSNGTPGKVQADEDGWNVQVQAGFVLGRP